MALLAAPLAGPLAGRSAGPLVSEAPVNAENALRGGTAGARRRAGRSPQ
ncbi:hypothetical protein ACWGBX_36920 [Streptomyces sp. NPDC055037]